MRSQSRSVLLRFLQSCRHNKHTPDILLALLVLLTAAFGFVGLHGIPLIQDEGAHVDQIESIRHFLLSGSPITLHQTTIPTYHFFLALWSMVAGTSATTFLRLWTLVWNLLTVAAFFLLAREIDPRGARQKTVQFLFFPLLFPFLFLVYTDIPSMLPVFLSLYATVKRKPTLAGLFAILAVLLRQTNIVWLLFDLTLLYVMDYGWEWDWENMYRHLARSWVFLFGIACFCFFLFINGGIALVDQPLFQAFSFHWGNIYFALFTFCALFLPLCLASQPKILAFLRSSWAVLIPIFLVVVPFLFSSFVNDHPYNHDLWWLRNRILLFSLQNPLREIFFFFCVFFGLASLIVIPLRQRSFRLLYPFALLSLASSWLVEPRYYLIPFALFILFRKTGSARTEMVICTFFVFLSSAVYYGLITQTYLP